MPHRLRPVAALILGGALFACAAGPAAAQQTNYIWDGGGGNSNWNTGANWAGNVAPSSSLTNTFITLSGSTQLNNTLNVNLSTAGLTFAAGAGAFTVSGANTLTIGSDGITKNSTTNQTFNAAIALGATQVWTNDESGTLAIGGTVATGGFGLTVTGAGTTTISGNISGTGSLTKTGNGPLTLSGSNSYSGGTSINGGTLSLGSSGALGTSGTISFGGGALEFSSSNTTDYSSRFSTAASQAYSIDTNGQTVTFATGLTSSGGTLAVTGVGKLILTGANTYSGLTTVTDTDLQIGNNGTAGSLAGGITLSTSDSFLTFSHSDSHTYAGAISGSGKVRNSGSGTLVLTGALSYTGETSAISGPLQFGSGGSLSLATTSISLSTRDVTFSHSNSLTYSGNITGSAGSSLTKAGTGTLTLGGTNTYTDGTTMSGGTLAFSSLSNLGSGGLTLSGGTLQWASGNTTDISTRTVTVSAGSTLDTNNNNVTLANPIGNGGSASLTKAGGGTLTLSAANTFTGTMFFKSGTVNFSALNNLGGGSTLQFTGGTLQWATGNTVDITARTVNIATGGGTLDTNGNNVTLANTINGNGLGSLTKAGGGTLAITSTSLNNVSGAIVSGGTLQIGSGNNVFNDVTNNGVLSFNRSSTLTVNAVISGTGSVIQNSSSGVYVVLAQDNTYTGGTTVTSGKLQIGSGGGSGSITGNVAVASGMLLEFFRTGTHTFAGAVSGAGDLTQSGTGTLVLTGDSTHTGTTTVAAGTLQLGNGGTSGSVAGNITNNAALVFNRGTTTYDHAGVISGTGSVTQSGTATVRLGGANTYTGTTTVSTGALAIGTGEATGSIVSDVVNNSTLIFNRTADYTYAGAISGSGGVFKVAGNTLTLTGTNTFAGTIHLEGGLVNFTTLSNLGNNTTLTFNGGGLQWATGSTVDISTRTVALNSGGTLDTNGNNVTLANAVGNGGTGGLTKAGSGTLTLSGTNTYTGGTTLKAGTLKFTTLNNLGSSGGITFNGGTLQWNTGSTVDISARTVTVSSGGGTLDVGSNNVTFGSGIGNAGTGGLTKTGSGTLIMKGASTYTGATTISQGTLQLGEGALTTGTLSGNIVNNSALVFNWPSASYSGAISGTGTLTQSFNSTLTLSGNSSYTGATNLNTGSVVLNSANAIGTSGTINFAGGTLQFSSSNTTDYSSRFSTAAGQAVNIHVGSQTITFATGLTSSGGTLSVSGNGTLVLTGTNTYTGTSTVTGAVLQIGSGGTSGSLAGNVANNAFLDFKRTDTHTYAGAISGAGQVRNIGSGTTILTGALSYTGTSLITAGTLQFGNGSSLGALPTGTIDLSNSGAVIFNHSNALTLSSTVIDSGGGSGNLTKQGTGTLTLTGTNTYDGITTLSGGTLSLGSSGALGTAGTIGFGGGTLQFSASNTTDYSARFSTAAGQAYSLDTNGQSVTLASALTSSGGTLTKSGAGTLTLSGANTYTGTTTVSAGTLRVNGSLAAGSAVAVNSGGTLSGSGTVNGPVTVNAGGAIAPGTSAGQLTIAGGLTHTAGTYTWELAALKDNTTGTAGTDFDQVALTGGSSTFGGTGQVSLDFNALPAADRPDQAAPNTFWTSTHTWDIVRTSGGATTTGLPALTTSSFAAGDFSLARSGNDLVLSFTPVPEPGAVLAVFAAGLGGAEWWRRRRPRQTPAPCPPRAAGDSPNP